MNKDNYPFASNEDQSKSYQRDLKDAQTIIKHAKLDESQLTEVTQALYYHGNDNRCNNLKLLELDEHILEQVVEGQKLYFKGAINEKAVLCTDERTYEIKCAEISNSLLLVPDLKFAKDTNSSPLKCSSHNNSGTHLNTSTKSIETTDEEKEEEKEEEDEAVNQELEGELNRKLEHRKLLTVFHEYFECREVKPRFRKLYDILQLTRYSGPENEEFIDRKLLFTHRQLLDTIQCSRVQLVEGLKTFRAFEFNSYIRILEYDYEFRIITLMLGLISENSWQLDEVERNETIDALEGIAPAGIVSGLFDMYTIKSPGKVDTFTYREDLVARCIAQNILQPGLKFKVDEFMSTWLEAMPEGMTVNEKYLNGLAIFDKDGMIPCIRSLFEYNLSLNIHERIRLLFRTKSKWTLEEIEPYIEYFTTSSVSASTLMAKHARAIVENGIRYYLAKH